MKTAHDHEVATPNELNTDNDDLPIGRLLNRREVLSLLGMASAALVAGCTTQGTSQSAMPTTASVSTFTPTPVSPTATVLLPTVTPAAATATAQPIAALPACIVRPEATEGPYYVDLNLVRSDIRTDSATGVAKEGTPLELTFNVLQVGDNGCTALAGATVEIWHCDATGAYSGVSDPGFDTSNQDFLRGAQVTDANGVAKFTSIYPGWYASRAVHIHFKIHPNESSVFTSQLFFDDALSDQAFAVAPYAAKGQRDTLNSTDSIYQELLLLTTTKTDQAYAATFPIGIDLSNLGTGQTGGGNPPGGAPRNGTPPPQP